MLFAQGFSNWLAGANTGGMLVRQAGAALGAAALQHDAPGVGRHPLEEPVFLGALQFFGLVGPFWHDFSFSL